MLEDDAEDRPRERRLHDTKAIPQNLEVHGDEEEVPSVQSRPSSSSSRANSRRSRRGSVSRLSSLSAAGKSGTATISESSNQVDTSDPYIEGLFIESDQNFKPKVLKRPPKYLRKDQPRNKWIIKPRPTDLMQDAETIAQNLLDHRIPRERRFAGKRRRRKKRRKKKKEKETKKNKVNVQRFQRAGPPKNLELNNSKNIIATAPSIKGWSSRKICAELSAAAEAVDFVPNRPAVANSKARRRGSGAHGGPHARRFRAAKESIIRAQNRAPHSSMKVSRNAKMRVAFKLAELRKHGRADIDGKIAKNKKLLDLEARIARASQEQMEEAARLSRGVDFVELNKGAAFKAPEEHSEDALSRFQKADERRAQARSAKQQLLEDSRKKKEALIERKANRRYYENLKYQGKTRSKGWIMLLQLASQTKRFFSLLEQGRERREEQKLLRSAAGLIGNAWARRTAVERGRKYRWAHMKVQSVLLKIALKRRSLAKRRAADRIRSFLLLCIAERFKGIMLKYRRSIIKAQRYYRSFRACKHARIVALVYWWEELERQYAIQRRKQRRLELEKVVKHLKLSEEDLHNKRRRKVLEAKRRKMLERKKQRFMQKKRVAKEVQDDGTIIAVDEEEEEILRLEKELPDAHVDGVQALVGEHMAAELDKHLISGIRFMLSDGHVEDKPVPFPMRFEVLHLFLTEVRRKHSVMIGKILKAKRLHSEGREVSLEGFRDAESRKYVQSMISSDSSAEAEKLQLPMFRIYTKLLDNDMLEVVKAGHRVQATLLAKHETFLPVFRPMFHPRYERLQETYSTFGGIDAGLFQPRSAMHKRRRASRALAASMIAKQRMKTMEEADKDAKERRRDSAFLGGTIVKVPSSFRVAATDTYV
eukprot:g1902.t1